MKKYFAAAVLFFSLSACGGADKMLEGTAWKLAQMEGIPAEAMTGEADAFTLNFSNADTMIYGRTNCNRFFGRYQKQGETLRFENMGMTRMACPDMQYEDAFVKMLEEVNGFKIKGDQLMLLNEKKTLATFAAQTGEEMGAEKK